MTCQLVLRNKSVSLEMFRHFVPEMIDNQVSTIVAINMINIKEQLVNHVVDMIIVVKMMVVRQ